MAKKTVEQTKNRVRFPERHKEDWAGPILDYKEVELLKKFLTPAGKMFGRKRAGTNAAEQRSMRIAIKRARFLGLLPYVGI